jgi:hypothetical protein
MSSDPSTSDEKFSEFVRLPTGTAGDLSVVADASPEITTEDLASAIGFRLSRECPPLPTTDTLGFRAAPSVPTLGNGRESCGGSSHGV